MWHRARRPGLLPLASAMLLSLAAGLSLAEEHAWHQAAAPPAKSPPVTSVSPTAAFGAADKPAQLGREGAGSATGVGSRALTGHREPAAGEDGRP